MRLVRMTMSMGRGLCRRAGGRSRLDLGMAVMACMVERVKLPG